MSVFIKALQTLFERELKRLKKEIVSYENESSLWIVEKEINNSAGNLCLHLCGNLQHFIGAVLGGSGYVRNRDYEFSAKNIESSKLVEEIETTHSIVQKTLSALQKNDLEKNYPEQVFGYEMTTVFFLIHLSGHLNYHLGQVNYHRRIFI